MSKVRKLRNEFIMKYGEKFKEVIKSNRKCDDDLDVIFYKLGNLFNIADFENNLRNRLLFVHSPEETEQILYNVFDIAKRSFREEEK